MTPIDWKPDGRSAVVYVPSQRSITVDLRRLTGGTSAQLTWVDPTSGMSTSVGAPVPTTGARTLTTPGANAKGGTDWVLLARTV